MSTAPDRSNATAAPTPAPSPAQRLEDLSQIILAYNEVAQKLQASHESLQAEVVRLQEKLASADAQLQRSRRLAALGEMAAGIAHEIRNPLGAIQLYAGMIVEDLDPAHRPACEGRQAPGLDATAQTAKKIVSAVRGLNAIVCDVLSFARDIHPRPMRVAASVLLDRALDAHRPVIDAARVRVDRRDQAGPGEAWVWVDPELMHQALLNVIRNAVEAMSPGEGAASTNPPQGQDSSKVAAAAPAREAGPSMSGLSRLSAGTTQKRTGKSAASSRLAAGRQGATPTQGPEPKPSGTLTLDLRIEKAGVVLIVRDTGPGIAVENIDRIFNPFFTTRNTGTGLGLAIVHRIVDAHGGAISVRNDAGAVFEIRVPAPAADAGEPAAAASAQPVTSPDTVRAKSKPAPSTRSVPEQSAA